LRAADLVAVGETTSVRPIDYRADDEWDRRFLGDAVALDASIEALAAGARAGRIDPESFSERVAEASARDDDRSAAKLKRLAGERRADHDQAIAVAVIAAARGEIDERWDAGIDFRDRGARWGLVAMELESDTDQVLDVLLDALDQAPELPSGLDLDASGAVMPSRSVLEADLPANNEPPTPEAQEPKDPAPEPQPETAPEAGTPPPEPDGTGGPDPQPATPPTQPDPAPEPEPERPALKLPVKGTPSVSTPDVLEPLDPVVDAV